MDLDEALLYSDELELRVGQQVYACENVWLGDNHTGLRHSAETVQVHVQSEPLEPLDITNSEDGANYDFAVCDCRRVTITNPLDEEVLLCIDFGKYQETESIYKVSGNLNILIKPTGKRHSVMSLMLPKAEAVSLKLAKPIGFSVGTPRESY